MWFGLYSRNNNQLDSSGFEHIFAGLDRADFFLNILFIWKDILFFVLF